MKEIPIVNTIKTVLVDDENYDNLIKNRWYLEDRPNKNTCYAYRIIRYKNNKGRDTSSRNYIHRCIMNVLASDVKIDHKDGDGLNCQKSNLRIATDQENGRNKRKQSTINGNVPSSKYKGVSWNKKAKCWTGSIHTGSKKKHLGVFTSEIEAAKAYNMAAITYFGDFANLNSIPDGE